MSGDRPWFALAFGVIVSVGTAAAEEPEPLPEEAFLEYLGSWEESDEEWLLYEEMLTVGQPAEEDPATTHEAPAEEEDEG